MSNHQKSKEERYEEIIKTAGQLSEKYALQFMEKIDAEAEYKETTRKCLEKLLKLGMIHFVKVLKNSEYATGVSIIGVISEISQNFTPRDIDIAVARATVELLEKSKELNS
jgi:hypothetical protein